MQSVSYARHRVPAGVVRHTLEPRLSEGSRTMLQKSQCSRAARDSDRRLRRRKPMWMLRLRKRSERSPNHAAQGSGTNLRRAAFQPPSITRRVSPPQRFQPAYQVAGTHQNVLFQMLLGSLDVTFSTEIE